MGWDEDDDGTAEVEARLVRVGNAASLLSCDGDEQWVPHSLIRGGDLDCLDPAGVGQSGTVEIAEWKAEELGWA